LGISINHNGDNAINGIHTVIAKVKIDGCDCCRIIDADLAFEIMVATASNHREIDVKPAPLIGGIQSAIVTVDVPISPVVFPVEPSVGIAHRSSDGIGAAEAVIPSGNHAYGVSFKRL